MEVKIYMQEKQKNYKLHLQTILIMMIWYLNGEKPLHNSG